MSESPVPTYVDTRKIFLQHGVVAGTIPFAKLPQFREKLASETGFIHVELEFFTDEFGQHIISGNLRAEIEVICQRCLEPLGIVLRDDIRLALLRDESKVAQLDAELDPWICADTKLDLANLVEEQLLLCMPIVSLHESTDCHSGLKYKVGPDITEQFDVVQTANPFASLKSLKNDDSTN